MKLCADPETMPDEAGLAEALRPELLKGFKAFQKNAKKVRDEQTKAVAQLGKLQSQLEAIKQK